MRELEPQYQDRIQFNVIPAAETAERSAEIEEFGFTALRHGLVGFDSVGDAQVKMPGHNFGKDEIRAAAESLLRESP